MKRYMVFVHARYYPAGGMGDFYNSFDKLEDILTALNAKQGISAYNKEQHGEIFDLEERVYSKNLEANDAGEWKMSELSDT